ncbi:protein FAM8A1 [Anabrus simplex]|uniref:protein FAM8A1 n=1 Tax=Anabrus simplex TaxID=316456 RepID=UPI0035A3405D
MADNSKPGTSKGDGDSAPQATNSPQTATYQSSSEYFEALEKWMQTVYMWQSVMASFPYLLMSNQCLPTVASTSFVNNTPGSAFAFASPFHPVPPGGIDGLRSRRPQTRSFRQAAPVNTAEGIEYRIPPIWKRFVAEFLDFLILFFVKLAVTFVAVDFFDVIDLDKYDLDLLSRNTKLDYKMAVEMTSEILLLEMMHRIVVCIFEAIWIRRGIGGRVGGATPGKSMMGIRVVLCEKVTPIEGRPVDIVLVQPGTDPGLFWAFARSFIKNLVLAVLFPVCFALFFFKFSRTGYDILCHTIVIEDAPRRR